MELTNVSGGRIELNTMFKVWSVLTYAEISKDRDPKKSEAKINENSV
jgi:hypothetical protein